MVLHKEKSRLTNHRTSLFACSALFVFTGCTTVGPDYVPPKTEMPAKFNTTLDRKNSGADTKTEVDAKNPKIPVKVVTQEMLARGFYLAQRGYMTLSLAHEDAHLDAFCTAFDAVLGEHGDVLGAGG